MSERKVLNKYYPPDFDPSKIPRARCPKNRKFAVRLMAPCNMKCLTCNEYIAQGKKFNARKEDVENLSYLGIRIYRFYIKCPGCLSEISFRTDPESTDYILEAGAHRNFQALRLAEAQAAKDAQEAKDEIKSNPMLLLENRTQQSQHEMEVLESLEDLRELNEVHAGIDLNKMAMKYHEANQLTKEQEEEMERKAALKALGYEEVNGHMVKRVIVDDDDDNEQQNKKKKVKKESIFHSTTIADNTIGKITLKSKFAGLVKKKELPQNFNDPSKVIKDPNNIDKDLSNNIKGKINGVKEPINGVKEPINGVKDPSNNDKEISQPVKQSSANSGISGLGMLGQYSDSESD